MINTYFSSVNTVNSNMDGSLSTVNSSMDGSNVAVEDLLVLGIYSYFHLLHIFVSILAQVQPLRLSTASKMSTLSTARRRMTEARRPLTSCRRRCGSRSSPSFRTVTSSPSGVLTRAGISSVKIKDY